MCSATSILPRQHVVAATADCGGGANESRNRNSSRGARLPKNRTKEIQAALSGIAGLWKQCLLLVALIPRAGGPEPTANHGPSEGRAGFTRSAENLVPRAHDPPEYISPLSTINSDINGTALSPDPVALRIRSLTDQSELPQITKPDSSLRSESAVRNSAMRSNRRLTTNY